MNQRTSRAAVGVLGAVATMLLHSLFFAAAIWGEGRAQRFPDRQDALGAGANQGRPEGDSAERRIVVRLLSPMDNAITRVPPAAFLPEMVRAALKVEITGPDALPLLPLVVEEGEPAESSDAEMMVRMKMAGIYESQVRARIERAWRIPADVQADERFTCRALILQHRDGRVREVELPYEGCEGTPQMRLSLVKAIFSASPLPAPPHPGVFVDSFSLVFRMDVGQLRTQRETASTD